MKLDNDQKQKIELEERYRLKVKKDIENEKKTGKSLIFLSIILFIYLTYRYNFGFLSFFLVIGSFVYTKNVHIINQYTESGRHKFFKKFGFLKKTIIWIVIILPIVFGFINYVNKSNKIKESYITPTPTVLTEEMKNDFISYYKEVKSLMDSSDNNFNQFAKQLDNIENGKANIYTQAKNTESLQKELALKLSTIDIPASLDSYKKEISKAKSDFSISIMARSQCAGITADFINTNNMDLLEKISNQKNLQQSTLIEGTGEFMEIGNKLGIDISTIK